MALAHRDFAAAIRYFRLVLDAEPNDRDTLFNLATAMTLTGDLATARSLRKAANDYDNLESLIEQVSRPSKMRTSRSCSRWEPPTRPSIAGPRRCRLVPAVRPAIPSAPRSRRRCSASNRRADLSITDKPDPAASSPSLQCPLVRRGLRPPPSARPKVSRSGAGRGARDRRQAGDRETSGQALGRGRRPAPNFIDGEPGSDSSPIPQRPVFGFPGSVPRLSQMSRRGVPKP